MHHLELTNKSLRTIAPGSIGDSYAVGEDIPEQEAIPVGSDLQITKVELPTGKVLATPAVRRISKENNVSFTLALFTYYKGI